LVLSRSLGFVFDPIGGIDGQQVVGPGAVGPVGAVRGGVLFVAAVAVVFPFDGGEQAVAAGSAEPVA
jgi:hypothetical protein